MASSWITTPQLRPSSDTASSASHPGLLVPNANLHMASFDIRTTGSPSIGFSQPPEFNQTLSQSRNLEGGEPVKRSPRGSGTATTIGDNSITQSKYMDMVLELIPAWVNLLAALFSWIILAGFLLLPSSFPTDQPVPGIRHVSLYVSFFPLSPLCKPKKWSIRP